MLVRHKMVNVRSYDSSDGPELVARGLIVKFCPFWNEHELLSPEAASCASPFVKEAELRGFGAHAAVCDAVAGKHTGNFSV